MSIQVMTRVWRYSKASGTALLMLLAIADHADDQGRAYPGTTSLARKARTSRRHVRNLTKTLQDLGELVIETGGGRRANTFHVVITEPVDATESAEGVKPASPVKASTPVNPVAGQPCNPLQGSPAIAIAGESSYKRHEPSEGLSLATSTKKQKRARRAEVPIDAFLDECKARGEKVFRDDDPLYTFADRAGIDHDWVRLCWLEFKHQHRESGKLQKDWRAHFRKCVRGNWYKIWYVDASDGVTKLGSQGRLLEQVHAKAA